MRVSTCAGIGLCSAGHCRCCGRNRTSGWLCCTAASVGDDRSDSDVDLIVAFAEPSVHALSLLSARLEEELGRPVQVVLLESVKESPTLLADVLRDGRALADRSGVWPRLKRREAQVRASAEAENARAANELVAAFEELFV